MNDLNKVPSIVKIWLRIKNAVVSIIVEKFSFFKFIRETEDYKSPITFDVWYNHKITGRHRYCYWPIHPTTRVVCAENVYLGIETFPGYMPGCYIQALGRITIGDHSVFSANVGIISSNHNLYDARGHDVGEVKIGRYCLVGMNAMILPGVTLGDFTIVGAGAVVTSSFEDGYCVIGGNPARVLKKLSPSDCVEYEVKHRYHGYLSEAEYQKYRDIHG